MHICVMKLRKQEKVKSDQLASERLSSVSFPRKLVNLKKKTLEDSTSQRTYPKTTFSHNNGFRRNVQRFASFPEKQSSSEIKDDSWNCENVAKRRFTTGILRREEIFGKWNSGIDGEQTLTAEVSETCNGSVDAILCPAVKRSPL